MIKFMVILVFSNLLHHGAVMQHMGEYKTVADCQQVKRAILKQVEIPKTSISFYNEGLLTCVVVRK
jgi:hypothetical protein